MKTVFRAHLEGTEPSVLTLKIKPYFTVFKILRKCIHLKIDATSLNGLFFFF